MDVRDDLSVSLLQARLIELGQPIRVVMDVSSVVPLDSIGRTGRQFRD